MRTTRSTSVGPRGAGVVRGPDGRRSRGTCLPPRRRTGFSAPTTCSAITSSERARPAGSEAAILWCAARPFAPLAASTSASRPARTLICVSGSERRVPGPQRQSAPQHSLRRPRVAAAVCSSASCGAVATMLGSRFGSRCWVSCPASRSRCSNSSPWFPWQSPWRLCSIGDARCRGCWLSWRRFWSRPACAPFGWRDGRPNGRRHGLGRDVGGGDRLRPRSRARAGCARSASRSSGSRPS